MAPGNAPDTHAGIEIGQGSSAYVSKWMALKGNATRVVGTGIVVNTDLGGKVVDTLGLPGSDVLCEVGKSPCPKVASCSGDTGCSTQQPAVGQATSRHFFGSFDDPAGTAAYGCDLCQDDVMLAVSSIESTSDGVEVVANATCKAPSARISEKLSSIAGWGDKWSGEYPPWAYNMNTGCPCGV
jgi:hypothetical protein